MPEVRRWQDHSGYLLDSLEGFDVIACDVCSYKHIVPIPAPKELAAAYQEDYYSVEKPLYIERHREDLAWWKIVYSDRYDTFEEHLPVGQRRILDVGSGPGFFLQLGKERGWNTLGVEPSVQASCHARSLGLTIIEEFLDESVAERLGKFDVVHMSQVLEHIPDPRGMLRLVHGLCDTGGLVCIVVPNDYNPLQRALRQACGYRPWWVNPPHHINYFDFASLSHLLTASGFEVIVREATFPIDMFLLMGEDYVGNDQVGRQCHARRKMLEQNLVRAGLNAVKRDFYRSLAENNLGREVFIVAVKR